MNANDIGKLFGEALRSFLPGVLFLSLFHFGRKSSPLPSLGTEGALILWGVWAAVLGVVVHSLVRFFFFDVIVRAVRNVLPIVHAERSLGKRGHAKFMRMRFSLKNTDPFQSYLTTRWSWVHAMVSTAFILVAAPVFVESGSELSSYGGYRIAFVVALFVGAGAQCLLLWEAEELWVQNERSESKKPPKTNPTPESPIVPKDADSPSMSEGLGLA